VAHEPRYGGGGANTVRARSGPVGAWPAPTADTARRNNLRLLLGGSGGQFYFARAERQAAREDIFSHRAHIGKSIKYSCGRELVEIF
jgi:hypothetical protein